VSAFSSSLQLAQFPASVARPSHLTVITPLAPHLSLVASATVPAHDRVVPAAAAPDQPDDSTVVVERFATRTEHGTCALCWSGPTAMAGTVHRLGASAEHRLICSRCMVTLEMLAVQFDSNLRLHIETSA
jgi:hypothetical protein